MDRPTATITLQQLRSRIVQLRLHARPQLAPKAEEELNNAVYAALARAGVYGPPAVLPAASAVRRFMHAYASIPEARRGDFTLRLLHGTRSDDAYRSGEHWLSTVVLRLDTDDAASVEGLWSSVWSTLVAEAKRIGDSLDTLLRVFASALSKGAQALVAFALKALLRLIATLQGTYHHFTGGRLLLVDFANVCVRMHNALAETPIALLSAGTTGDGVR